MVDAVRAGRRRRLDATGAGRRRGARAMCRFLIENFSLLRTRSTHSAASQNQEATHFYTIVTLSSPSPNCYPVRNAATQHTPPLRRTKIYHASPPACPATPPASPSISSQTCPVVLKFVNFILSDTDAIRSGSSPAPFFSVKSDPASSRAFATSVRWKRAAMCNGVFPCRSL